jgi:signal peptide peptidase SppA
MNSLFLSWVASQAWAVERGFADVAMQFLTAREARSALPEASHMFAKDDDKKKRGYSSGSVALIPIHGAISHRISDVEGASVQRGVSSERIGQWVDAAMNDDDISAIVLDINSPGGHVAGTVELANKIYGYRGGKPIVAVANANAASAAYWIGTAADRLYVTPSGMVGSIGVLMPHVDVSKKAENEGVKVTFIHAGERKVMGNEFEPLTDEVRAVMQEKIDKMYESFVGAVALHRGTDTENVKENFGKGDMVLANDALAAGMVDGVMTLEQVISELFSGDAPRKKSSVSMKKRQLHINSLRNKV